jgi:plasmid stabilization system protein ParE
LTEGTPRFTVRLSKLLRCRLDEIANDAGAASTASYVRSVLVTHVTLARSQNTGDSHPDSHPDFRRLDHAVKQFILATQNPVTIAASLPGKARRHSLEELTWEAVLEAIKFAKAQDDPELRLLAMRVASSIMRTELAVLHDVDQAAVDELVTEVESGRSELAKKARESAKDKATV